MCWQLLQPVRSASTTHVGLDVLLKTAIKKFVPFAGEEVGLKMRSPTTGGDGDRALAKTRMYFLFISRACL